MWAARCAAFQVFSVACVLFSEGAMIWQRRFRGSEDSLNPCLKPGHPSNKQWVNVEDPRATL